MTDLLCVDRTVVCILASQREGPGFESTDLLGPFYVWFACSPRVSVVNNMRVRLTSDSKLIAGVNCCLFICWP